MYLVKAELYPWKRSVGSKKCNRVRCQTYTNVNKINNFTGTVTGKTY